MKYLLKINSFELNIIKDALKKELNNVQANKHNCLDNNDSDGADAYNYSEIQISRLLSVLNNIKILS